MKPILVAYATKHGSTEQVAASVAARLRSDGLDVELRRAETVRDLEPYAGVVLGAPLYTGRWLRPAIRFLKRHRRRLSELPLAVFALGPRTLDPADTASSRAQLSSSLAKVPELQPYELAIFGGVIDPRKLTFPLSRMQQSDARDWDAIDLFARECGRPYGYGKPAADARGLHRELQQTHR
jgi:menaquinone-dependent protoporphyrinogen oxidase